MYIYIYIFLYSYICIFIEVHIYIYICIFIYVYTHIHIYIYICMYIYIYVCTYIHMCMFLFICVHFYRVCVWYVRACVRVHTLVPWGTHFRTCMRQFTYIHPCSTHMHARTSHAGWQAQDRGAMTHGPSMQTRTLIGMRFVKYAILKKSWLFKTNKTDTRNEGSWPAPPLSTSITSIKVSSPPSTTRFNHQMSIYQKLLYYKLMISWRLFVKTNTLHKWDTHTIPRYHL